LFPRGSAQDFNFDRSSSIFSLTRPTGHSGPPPGMVVNILWAGTEMGLSISFPDKISGIFGTMESTIYFGVLYSKEYVQIWGTHLFV